MDRNTSIDLLGKTGEKIIANMLNSQGLKVEYSIDNYDREKDFLVEGKKIEVKTEQPYVKKNAISIRETQLKKCKTVDILYFVSVPPLINKNYKWGGWIFCVDPKTFVYNKYTTKFGINMIEIPIEQPAVNPVKKLSNVEIDELLKYAMSAYAR